MAGAAPNSAASDPTTAANAGSIATGVGIALAVALALIFLVARHRSTFGALGALRETTNRSCRKHAHGLDGNIINSFPITRYKQPRLSTDRATSHPSRRPLSIDLEAAGGNEINRATRTSRRHKGQQLLGRLWVQRRSFVMLGRPLKGRPRQGTTCSICTEDFTDGIEVRKLPCSHLFHPACVDQWLTEFGVTCPVCRVNLAATATADISLKKPRKAALATVGERLMA
ncbi:Receptor-like proteiny region transmembrane domain and RING domain-containing protein 2 [Apiospora arundinis]|uniref:Receptor-like proteiny region transmembrane domain and RING domain-containing protein 2 n=1 Tax=Apiospora arundinis TaxID=335852 RepID=A0ABR2IIF5_9PEZI